MCTTEANTDSRDPIPNHIVSQLSMNHPQSSRWHKLCQNRAHPSLKAEVNLELKDEVSVIAEESSL